MKFSFPQFLVDLAIASVMTLAFGAACSVIFPEVTVLAGAGWMLGIAGTGWAVLILWHLLKNGLGALEYLAVLGVTMRIGVLILIPSIACAYLQESLPIWLPIVNVLLSSGTMAIVHTQAVRKAKISHWHTVGWFAALQISAAAWVLLFMLNQHII